MRGRRLLVAFGAILIAGLVAACSPVDRVAARLNGDGTVDFGICEGSRVDKFEVYWVYEVGSGPMVTTPVTGELHDGDVFRLEVPPKTGDEDYLVVDGVRDDRITVSGHFYVEDLSPGEWAWNQTGVFVGAVDVEHCALDDNVRSGE